MDAAIDHVGLPVADPKAAASFLRDVLGTGKVILDGPADDDSGDMYSLVFGGWSLAYVRAAVPAPHHLAIRVDEKVLRPGDGSTRRAQAPLRQRP